jgi:hypothetical protein
LQALCPTDESKAYATSVIDADTQENEDFRLVSRKMHQKKDFMHQKERQLLSAHGPSLILAQPQHFATAISQSSHWA